METSSGKLGCMPPAMAKGRLTKSSHALGTAGRMASMEDSKHGSSGNERAEGKKKGRPRAENQELRGIPAAMMVQWKEEFKNRSRVKCPSSGCWLEFPSIYGLKYHYQRCQGTTIAEKLSHRCPYCEAIFASKVRLQKHKTWNHPERVSQEPRLEPKLPKGSAKAGPKKRPAENATEVSVIAKVKKTQEASRPSQNGECALQKADKRQHATLQGSSSEPSPKTPGGSESEGGSLPPPYLEEDPERTRHRRKQKTPKKFTGEQPSISGTFGLKGMNKVEEKLKSGRVKRMDGHVFNEEPVRKLQNPLPKKDSPLCSGALEAQWQHTITEQGEVMCPTCSLVSRKTVVGLRKHMDICQKLQDALRCQQCQKQFRSKAGLNYHTMAEHDNKPSGREGPEGDEQQERERLRKVLKQMGKLKCPSEGCSAHFSSLMGYQYHQKRCGKELAEAEKPVFRCWQCDKSYKSKAGRDYHVRSEHASTPIDDLSLKTEDQVTRKQPTLQEKPVEQQLRDKDKDKNQKEEQESLVEEFERTPSGRVRRRSAQVAVFHLQEIAEDELARDWGTKRRMKDDLVPDIRRLNYTRPGLPEFSPKMLENWKNEVKEKGFICCPNSSCEAVYSSVSGLKAHLANCNKGGGTVGKYRCLLCQKEFNSESGVKYHISKTHSQNWFRASGHMAPNSKRKEPKDNKKDDPQKSTVAKKRGRKPREQPVEVQLKEKEEPLPAKTEMATQPPYPAPAPQPDPPTLATRPSQNRDGNPVAKRRGKPKKGQATD